MKVSMSKKYRYRNGEAARILCVDSGSEKYPVISVNQAGDIETHTVDGMEYLTNPRKDSQIDLIEISKYDDFKIDDKIIYWNDCENFRRRGYFNKTSNGNPLVFASGKTSFSSNGVSYMWDNCVKYTGEDNGHN